MVVQVYKPSAAKVETGGFLGLAGQPSLVGEFQTSDKLLLRDTNKTSDLHHTHTHAEGWREASPYCNSPRDLHLPLTFLESHRPLERLYSANKMAASSGNLRPDVQCTPGSSSFDELQACSNHDSRILVLAAPRKGKG